MTIRNLDKMFAPRSVAFFGASVREHSVGKTVADNLLANGYAGAVWPVNPKYKEINGAPCYRDVDHLPAVPDLAIIATPPEIVLLLIKNLGEEGTRAAVVITAGVDEVTMLKAAQPFCLRIIGPNCFGLMLPSQNFNGSFAHLTPQSGDLAFISQSGAIISAVIDWAAGQNIGFSQIVSLGNMADVDVGDVLDFLAGDQSSRAILMYLEQVTNPAKFMSAARAAARSKPVIVIKGGRHAEGAKAAASHTGAMAGADIVYDAAFHRAGLLRVRELEEMFDAAEVLSRLRPGSGRRLTILTNGGGAGVMAVDRLIDYGGSLAALNDLTLKKLDKILPAGWSKDNPVDIIGDAGPERYAAALEIVLGDKNSDAVLVIDCPTALASSSEAASAVIKTLQKNKTKKPVLGAWLGGEVSQEGRDMLARSNIPAYATPEDAIRGFTYLTGHARLQEELMQTPPALGADIKTTPEKSRKVLQAILKEGRTLLTETEAKDILIAYGIPVVRTIKATTPQEVYKEAKVMLKTSPAVAVKILSHEITHKSDAGGVALALSTAEAAKDAALDMSNRLKDKIEGFTVQPMIHRPNAHELILGVSEDRTFGPVILFGAGGTGAEVIDDKAVSLPPLDMRLAQNLIERTRISKLLKGYRNRKAADMNAIALTLVRLSNMIAELPEISELDINPLLADEKGVIALDARIVIKEADAGSCKLNPRFSIRPYPKQWEKEETLAGGKKIFIRPVRPEDERLYETFMNKTNAEDIRLRLFSPLRYLSHDFIARLTQIDYARAMAFIALDPETNEMLGISRLACDPDYARAEYGVITRSDVKGQGIGWALMKTLINYAECEGIGALWGQIMRENTTMLKMCRELGFGIEPDPDDKTLVIAALPLARKSKAA